MDTLISVGVLAASQQVVVRLHERVDALFLQLRRDGIDVDAGLRREALQHPLGGAVVLVHGALDGAGVGESPACFLLRDVNGLKVYGAFFALHTLFDATSRVTAGPLDLEYPQPASLDSASLAITALGCALIFWRRWSVLRTLGACALAGLVIGLATSI